jgi:aminoglycoside/choline kinase family phosphotransferase
MDSKNTAVTQPPFFLPENIKSVLASDRLQGVTDICPIDAGASLRRYFRIRFVNSSTAILSSQGGQYDAFRSATNRLSAAAIAVPDIVAEFPQEKCLVSQDLGSDNIYTAIPGFLESHRDQLIEILRRFGNLTPRAEDVRFMPAVFDQEWTNLILPLFADDRHELLNRDVLPTLQKVFQQPQQMAHRDLQSSNLFLHEQRVYVIDYQSLLLAHPYYDLVSLVWDSYIDLENEKRWQTTLTCGKQLDAAFDPEVALWVALQRKLHDIGAFQRAMKNGKGYFEQYIGVTEAMCRFLLLKLNLSELGVSPWR